jgi:hypothetical protein
MPTAENTAEEIVVRIVQDMTAVLERRKKQFAKGAISEWRGGLVGAVQENLDKGGNWASSRDTVRRVARDMARIAAILSGSKPTVSKAQVDAAFEAIRTHEECRPGTLRGRWCDF